MCLSVPQIAYCIAAISDMEFRHDLNPVVAHSILCNLTSELQSVLDVQSKQIESEIVDNV